MDHTSVGFNPSNMREFYQHSSMNMREFYQHSSMNNDSANKSEQRAVLVNGRLILVVWFRLAKRFLPCFLIGFVQFPSL
jgi:hypothetical protein